MSRYIIITDAGHIYKAKSLHPIDHQNIICGAVWVIDTYTCKELLSGGEVEEVKEWEESR